MIKTGFNWSENGVLTPHC